MSRRPTSEVVWTITNGGRRATGVRPSRSTLDALHALPDHAGSDVAGLLGRLAERDVHVVENADGFELAG